jgi:hypothetical protein
LQLEHTALDPRADLEWMDIQIAALFVSDTDGRLRYNAEPGYGESELDPAPRFFMGRTREGNRWRFRRDLPDALVRDLEDACRSEPTATNLSDPSTNMAAIRTALHAHVLEANFPWKRASPSGVKTGMLTAAVVAGSAVSICYCARLTAVTAEAGVETVEAARGHGCASAAVAAWAWGVRYK